VIKFNLNLGAQTFTWEDITPTTQAIIFNGTHLQRTDFAMAQALDESGFWVYGGSSVYLSSNVYLGDYLFFSYTSQEWTTYGQAKTVNGTSINSRVSGPYTVANGKLYIFGGTTVPLITAIPDIIEFDLTTLTWAIDQSNNFTTDNYFGNAVAVGTDIYITVPSGTSGTIYKYILGDAPIHSSSSSPSDNSNNSDDTNTNSNIDTNTIAPTDDDNNGESSAFALIPSIALILALNFML
jgi:hypothetical protein